MAQPVKSCLLYVNDDRLHRAKIVEGLDRSRVLRWKPDWVFRVSKVAACRVNFAEHFHVDCSKKLDRLKK